MGAAAPPVTRGACQAGVRSAGDSRSKVLVTGRAPTASKLSATLATISATSSGPAVDSLPEVLIE